jgi:hypothetical protein
LPNLVDKTNTAGDVWADTAYRSAKNEKHLADNGLRSQILRKKPQGKPMPEAVARANGKKSKVRAYVEHVFAQQKGPMDLVIRTIGLARATIKVGLANLTNNMKRAVWLSARTKPNARSTQRKAVLAAQINAARSAPTSVRHRLTTFRRHRPTGNTVLGGVQVVRRKTVGL